MIGNIKDEHIRKPYVNKERFEIARLSLKSIDIYILIDFERISYTDLDFDRNKKLGQYSLWDNLKEIRDFSKNITNSLAIQSFIDDASINKLKRVSVKEFKAGVESEIQSS